jgi:hypothetical protein
MRPFFETVKNTFLDNPIVGAEIGVALGENAKNVLEGISNIKTLYLIDPYFPYNGCLLERVQNSNKEKAFKLLSGFKNIEFVYHTSEWACSDIPIDILDFVYIDGDHSYLGITKDIEYWFPRLKVGGIIGGHDFESSEDNHAIARVVSKFVSDNNYRLTVENSDWWIIK